LMAWALASAGSSASAAVTSRAGRIMAFSFGQLLWKADEVIVPLYQRGRTLGAAWRGYIKNSWPRLLLAGFRMFYVCNRLLACADSYCFAVTRVVRGFGLWSRAVGKIVVRGLYYGETAEHYLLG